MRLLTKKLPRNHNIFFVGDVHEGSVLSSDKGWDTFCNIVCSEYRGCKNNFVAEGGDMLEAITIDDKRFSREKMAEALPLQQKKRAVIKRKPIKDKYLWMLEGNHERKLWRFGDLAAEIADELGIDYGTYTTKCSITNKLGRLLYKVFDTHGYKSISSTADDPIRRDTNMKLQLKRHLKFKAADCAVMIKHHVHKLLVSEPTHSLYLTDDGKKIKQHYTHWGQDEQYIHPDARWYGCAGSFVRLYGEDMSGYAEIAEYDPVEIGWLVLMVRDEKIVGLEPYYLQM